MQGSADQSRNPQFVLTGALTGNILILWPQNVTRNFGVVNNTTGAFSVTLCVNNGSGGAAGAEQVLPQGASAIYYSDGTNIQPRLGPFTGTGAFVLANGATLVTPALGAATATSLAIGGATLGGNVLAVKGNVNINGMTTIYNGSPSNAGTDTEITATATFQAQGVFLMAYCACQDGAGNQTYAAIYMLRFPSSGTSVTATRIALDAGSTGFGDFVFSVNGSGHLVVTPPGLANTQVVIQQMTG